MAKKIQLVTILIFLTSIPTYWVFNNSNPKRFSVVENRYLTTFPSLFFLDKNAIPTNSLDWIRKANFKGSFNQLIDRSFQLRFEKATADNFPFRESIISFVKEMERSLIAFSYSFLDDKQIPTDLKSGMLVDSENQYLIKPPILYSQQTKVEINERVKNYREINQNHPTLSIMLFYINTIDRSAINPANQFFPGADAGKSFEYFVQACPSSISIKSLIAKNIDEYYSIFFRTDHHWNYYGYQKAYDLLYDYYHHKYPQLNNKILPDKVNDLNSIKFLGSLARKSKYPILPDSFPLPIYSQNRSKDFLNGRNLESIEENQSRKSIYTNYYAYFYGLNKEHVEYTSNNGLGNNLLIIGDSYAKPIAPLLAQHFSHTYFVDLRANTDFSINSYINKYSITDLLVIGNANVVYADTTDWLIDP